MEENPGPTIFDIIDSTTTVSADSSQGNEALFDVNAGKQCVAMSLTAIIYHQIQDISLWTNTTLNNILVIGNNLYNTIRCSVRSNDYLLFTVAHGGHRFHKEKTLQIKKFLANINNTSKKSSPAHCKQKRNCKNTCTLQAKELHAANKTSARCKQNSSTLQIKE